MLRINDILDKVAEYQPQADLSIISRAYVYSAKVHAGQMRRSGEAYLVHPLQVADILADMGMDVTSIAVGLLHDTLEDTLTTEDDLTQLFGKDVTQLVDGLTKLGKLEFRTREQSQAETFRKMLLAMAEDMRVILIKLADRLHNMRTLEYMKPESQRRIAAETMDIYAPLANRLGISWLKVELEDISLRYLKPEIFERLEREIAAKRKQREGFVKRACKEMQKELDAADIKTEVSGRVKHVYSVYKKMEVQQLALDEVYDLVGARVMVNSLSDCYAAMGILHQMWVPVPGRIKDYIAMPKSNGYKSLHTTVMVPDEGRLEIQIRTREMHAVAEYGVAAHWRYKESGSVDEQFEWLRRMAELGKEELDSDAFMAQVKTDLFPTSVFVFTPAGEVKDLPRGSTPVDFAYSIHSAVGMRCNGARVNGKLVPLRTVLRNGDTVEILTGKVDQPNKDWLDFVVSSRAKQQIRSFHRRIQRERSQELGREIAEKELRKLGINFTKETKTKRIDEVCKSLGFGTLPELLQAIGFGKLEVKQFAKALKPDIDLVGEEKTTDDEESFVGKLIARATNRKGKTGGILVGGLNDVLVRFAGCCTPVPGEPIIGFVSRGRGVVIHRSNCPRAHDFATERKVDVEWAGMKEIAESNAREVHLRIVGEDVPGMLAQITKSISEAKVNMTDAKVKTVDGTRLIGDFQVQVNDSSQLQSVMRVIEGLNGIISVERISL